MPSGIDWRGVQLHCIKSQSVSMNLLNHLDIRSTAVVLLLVLGGCSSAPPVGHGSSIGYLNMPPRLSESQSSDVTLYAVGLVGTPYRHGGNTPEAGFDCSGLIGHVYKMQVGVAAPRTVAKLQTWGQPVSGNTIRAGDLVLFTQNNVATHAGIYVGDGRFVHAPSTGGEVRLDQLNSKYWSSRQVTFRRP